MEGALRIGLKLTPLMSKSRKMKFENYENIHDDFFIIRAFQNNLNGKHANICSDRRKETNENLINTPRPLPPKVVRIPISFSSFLDVFWF